MAKELEQTGTEAVDEAGQQVVDQTGNTEAVAASQFEGEQTDEVKGLIQAKQAETKKRQELEQQLQAVQQQMLVNNAQPQPQVQNQPQSQDEQIASYLQARGIDPEYATPVQIFKVIGELQANVTKQQQTQSFMAQNQDYYEVVGQRNAYGQYVKLDGTPSAFQLALNKEPYLAQSVNSELVAYSIGKKELELSQLQMQNTQTQTQDNQLLAAAATAPMAGVSAGGGGVISDDAGIANIDFATPEGQAYYERVKAGEFD